MFFRRKKVTLDKLNKIEDSRKISLPQSYKRFYLKCEKKIPKNWVGTDLLNKYPELNEWAIDLLEENEIPNFLTKKDFVFMIHQGYFFRYFRADGNKNPNVYSFLEGDSGPKKENLLNIILEE